jgi:hypothetical protein
LIIIGEKGRYFALSIIITPLYRQKALWPALLEQLANSRADKRLKESLLLHRRTAQDEPTISSAPMKKQPSFL